jgi:hypothetical protein
MATEFGSTTEDARPAMVAALAAAREHFRGAPDSTLVLAFPAGTYTFEGTQASIDLPNSFAPGAGGRLVIHGAGPDATTLVTARGDATGIDARNVQRVTFKCLHFARNYYTVTQGDVVSVTRDAMVIALHEGYPTPEALWSIPGKRIQQGKYLRKYSSDPDDPRVLLDTENRQVHYDPERSFEVRDRVWSFWMTSNQASANSYYQPGDTVGIKTKHGANTYFFAGGDDIVFEDILWTHRSRGVLRSGINNIRFTRCKTERLPPLHGRAPCLSTPGGGPQIGQPNDSRTTNITVEDCDFDSSGDDNFALFNVDGAVIRNTRTANSFARSILLHDDTDVRITNTEVRNGVLQVENEGAGRQELSGMLNIHVNPPGSDPITIVELP